MRTLHIFSLSLLLATMLSMSCSNEDSGPKECDGSLALMVESKTNLSTCVATDGSITVSASGGDGPYSFSLNGGAVQASTTFSGLAAGSYSIKVIDKNKCENLVENIVIQVPGTTLAFASVNVTPDTNCSSSNGSIVATGTGGTTTAAYQYALNDGSFGASGSFTGLAPGTYTVKVKDAAGCVVTQSAQISQGNRNITYNNDILTIFNAKCTGGGCHPNNGDWFTYTTAKSKATAIKTRTGNKTMPPGSPLSDAEIALIACWADDGAQQ